MPLGEDAPGRGCGRVGRILSSHDLFSRRTDRSSVPGHHRPRPRGRGRSSHAQRFLPRGEAAVRIPAEPPGRAPLLLQDQLDLGTLPRQAYSLLIEQPDRSQLLGRGRGSWACYSRSTAIYVGENPGTHKIENSIQIHITPTNAVPPAPPKWLQKMMKRIPVHLGQYRQKNRGYVRYWTCVFSGCVF